MIIELEVEQCYGPTGMIIYCWCILKYKELLGSVVVEIFSKNYKFIFIDPIMSDLMNLF